MELAGKNILVVGLGRTGLATARFLNRIGGRVTVTDIAPEACLEGQLKMLGDIGVRLEIGQHRSKTFLQTDLIVVSPGVPHTIAPLQQALKSGIEVIGEIELASRFIRDPIIAVTGTNGKTTTTTLLGEIFKAAGRNVFVGGNIGNPLIEYVEQQARADCIILEVSSFQLDTIDTFRPDIAVLLNVTPDHLDRYPDHAAYVASKSRIFMNQTQNDIAILNAADPAVRSLEKHIAARKLYFAAASTEELCTEPGAAVQPDGIRIRLESGRVDTIDLAGIQLIGRHNLENMAAASLAGAARGIPPALIESTLKTFKGLPHRLEYIATRQGIDYINDSKSTNIGSVAMALESFSAPVLLILGGRNKGGDFSVLKNVVGRQVKTLIAMGESRETILAVFSETVPTRSAATMSEALSLAKASAVAGDTILLSPGCASFDLYENYAQRGEDFRKLAVNS